MPSVVLIENEYLIAHLRLDQAWTEALLDDLRSGRLNWNADDLREFARKFSND